MRCTTSMQTIEEETMRISQLVCAASLAAALAATAACYRNREPPVGSTRTTSADTADPNSELQDPWARKDAGPKQNSGPYDSDYERYGEMPGINPEPPTPPPTSHPVPWNGPGAAGSGK